MSKIAVVSSRVALGLALILSASPVQAASKSQTFDVSCSVKQVFQISSPSPVLDPTGGFQPAARKEIGVSGSGSGISVLSNLIQTRVNTEMRRQAGVNVKVYSVTVI